MIEARQVPELAVRRITGERFELADWTVTLGPRRYDVFVDDHGCMLAATLADAARPGRQRSARPAALRRAARGGDPRAGDRDVTVRIIPHVSHTLCPDVIGSVQAWTWLPSWRLSSALLETVTRWLTAELHA